MVPPTGVGSPIDRKIHQDVLSKVESPRVIKSKPKTDVEVSLLTKVYSFRADALGPLVWRADLGRS